MTYETIVPMWDIVREKFMKKIHALQEEDLALQLGNTTIGGLIYHTGEAEYIFLDWYFGKSPDGDTIKPALTDKAGLIDYLIESDLFLKSVMKNLPEEKWNEVVDSKMGSSTPLEAISRLIYHTGIHAGQMTYIQKYGQKNSL